MTLATVLTLTIMVLISIDASDIRPIRSFVVFVAYRDCFRPVPLDAALAIIMYYILSLSSF